METTIRENTSKLKILTPFGWSNFSGVTRTLKSGLVTLILENGTFLKCSYGHRILTGDGSFKKVETLKENETVRCDGGNIKILSISSNRNHCEHLYDVKDVELYNCYYTNNIVSHNCVEFLGSSGTLISGNSLRQLIHRIPLASVDGLSTYFNPSPARQYALIADTSRGKGLDYSAFSVIDITEMPYQQVCVFRNNTVPPQEYAEIINRVGRHYNTAAVLIELNDLGQQVSDILFETMEYENILHTSTSAGRRGKHITLAGADKSERGITTTTTVKSLSCSIAKLLIEQKQLIVNDFHTIEELSRFSRKGNSYEAEPGFHDDLVMSLLLFAWVSQDQYFKELTDINTIAKLRERTEEQVEADLMPFGFEDNGPAYDETEVLTPENTMMTFEQLLMG